METVEDALAREYVVAELAGVDPREAVAAETARLAVDAERTYRKNRAERRARGHRTSPRVHSARLHQAPRAETGAQRAQRRAAAKGLTVGAPVRARIGVGVGAVRTEPNPHWIPYGERTNAGQEGAAPLDVAARLFNYQTQVSVRGHALVGTNWRPTPRQFRRIIKNVSSRATREMLRADRDRRRPRYVAPEPTTVRRDDPEFVPKVVAALLDPTSTAKPERERSAINRNGFRVVDRRGEHR